MIIFTEKIYFYLKEKIYWHIYTLPFFNLLVKIKGKLLFL